MLGRTVPIDKEDRKSLMDHMETKVVIPREMEKSALALGANYEMVKKWRYRGVPLNWQVKLGFFIRAEGPPEPLEAAK
jgi:hypothetical protein